MLSSSVCSCPRLSAVRQYDRVLYHCVCSQLEFLSLWDDLKLTPCFVLDLLFVSFCHDIMLVLGLRGCMECVEDHRLFIRVIILFCSGQRVSVSMHVCSTSLDTIFINLRDFQSLNLMIDQVKST